LRDIAEKVGITERAVQHIVADLVRGGYLSRTRSGRRNRYSAHLTLPLRHPIEAHQTIGTLVQVVLGKRRPARTTADGISSRHEADSHAAVEMTADG
ncbi:MAG: hypothetical protein ACRDD1_12650, partial [Planctomycetia bacterium]